MLNVSILVYIFEFALLFHAFQGGDSCGFSEKANSVVSTGSGRGRKNFTRSGPSGSRRFDNNNNEGYSKPRGTFSTSSSLANRRQKQHEGDDTAVETYVDSVSECQNQNTLFFL